MTAMRVGLIACEVGRGVQYADHSHSGNAASLAGQPDRPVASWLCALEQQNSRVFSF